MHSTNSDTKHHIIVNSLLIVGISSFICVISILGGELDYPGNDDTFRNLISVGAFGDQYAYYINYSNVLYGIPIRLLNILIPSINWYYWIMIVLSLISIISLCILVLSNCSVSVSVLGTVVINVVLARDFYCAIQFTKVASLWGICGILVLTIGLINRKLYWIYGLLLALYGFLCRKECILLVMPFILLMLAFYLFTHGRAKNNEHYVLKRLPMIAIAFIIPMIAEFVFCHGTEWADFWTVNDNSSIILDFTKINYADHAEEYERIGLSENALKLFQSWEYGDTDYFTTERLSNIIEISECQKDISYRINPLIVKQTFINMFTLYDRTVYSSLGVPILAIAMMIIMMIGGKLRTKFFVIFNIFELIGGYWYFTCQKRIMWRAELGLWLAVIFCMAFYVSVGSESFIESMMARRVFLIIFTFILSSYTIFMAYNYRYVKEGLLVNHEADITGLLNSFGENEKNFYFLTDFYVTNNPMSITASKYRHIYENSCYMGSWIIPSPHGMYYLRQRGMNNPMRSLVDYDNTYLIIRDENKLNLIKTHLVEMYKSDIITTNYGEFMWKFELGQ